MTTAIFTRDVKGQTQRCWTTKRSRQRERPRKQCWQNNQGEQTPLSGEHLEVDLYSWRPHKGSRLRGDRSISKARILSPCLHPTWADSGGAATPDLSQDLGNYQGGTKLSKVSNFPSSSSDKSSIRLHRITMMAKRPPGGLKATKSSRRSYHTTTLPHDLHTTPL